LSLDKNISATAAEERRFQRAQIAKSSFGSAKFASSA
jgi:hypothetical protein